MGAAQSLLGTAMLASDRPPLYLQSPPPTFPRWIRHPQPFSCHRQVSPQGSQRVNPALLPPSRAPGALGLESSDLTSTVQGQGGLPVICLVSKTLRGRGRQRRAPPTWGLHGKLDSGVCFWAPGSFTSVTQHALSCRGGPPLEDEQTLAQRG